MEMTEEEIKITEKITFEVKNSKNNYKKLKLKTLLSMFGFEKRSDANTIKITKIINNAGFSLSPPITRLGEEWKISQQDWIFIHGISNEKINIEKINIIDKDGWIKKVSNLELRTEKEVETKFIIPLLNHLGYTEDDRYDGMPVPAAHGSKNTTLVIDFAVFNSSVDSIKHQPLLTIEAKKEGRLLKKQELLNAHNQAKSYSLWTQCEFFMITDSQTLQIFHIAKGQFGKTEALFSCERKNLAENFSKLYSIISKDALTKNYLSKFFIENNNMDY